MVKFVIHRTKIFKSAEQLVE